MRFRKLRITWTVRCGIATVLLSAFTACERREEVVVQPVPIQARGVKITKSSNGKAIITANNDLQDVARVYYRLRELSDVRNKLKPDEIAQIQSVCLCRKVSQRYQLQYLDLQGQM
jgi:hypothetical protein